MNPSPGCTLEPFLYVQVALRNPELAESHVNSGTGSSTHPHPNKGIGGSDGKGCVTTEGL